MRNILLILVIGVGFTHCTQENIREADFDATKNLNAEEQLLFLQKIIYNVGKWPESANKNTVKNAHYNEDFEKEVKLHTLKYYFTKNDTIYFGVWKVAPSLEQKFRLTAGKLTMGENGPIYYEEIFRTWKMTPEKLKEKGSILFAKLLNGEDLSPYYNHNSGEEEWIEFPDIDVNWDQKEQTWVSPKMKVLEDLYAEKRAKMEAILKRKQDSLSKKP